MQQVNYIEQVRIFICLHNVCSRLLCVDVSINVLGYNGMLAFAPQLKPKQKSYLEAFVTGDNSTDTIMSSLQAGDFPLTVCKVQVYTVHIKEVKCMIFVWFSPVYRS